MKVDGRQRRKYTKIVSLCCRGGGWVDGKWGRLRRPSLPLTRFVHAVNERATQASPLIRIIRPRPYSVIADTYVSE